MTTISTDTDLLAELVGRKLTVLVQLREMGQRQIEFIEQGDLSQLLKVLSAKQRLLAALQGIETQLQPFRGQDPEARSWRNGAERRQCAQVLAQCEELLREIVEQEKQSEAALVTHRDEAAARLASMNTAATARGAYQSQSHFRSAQLDLSSET